MKSDWHQGQKCAARTEGESEDQHDAVPIRIDAAARERSYRRS